MRECPAIVPVQSSEGAGDGMSAIRDQPITSVREGVFLMCDSGVTGYDEEERGR